METCLAQAHAPNDSLSKIILKGTLEGGRSCGPQRKCWMDNIKGGHPCPARTAHKGLMPKKKKKGWKRISAEPSLMFPSGPIGHLKALNRTERFRHKKKVGVHKCIYTHTKPILHTALAYRCTSTTQYTYHIRTHSTR